MKILLISFFALLSWNRVVEKEPVQTQSAESIRYQGNTQVQRDTLKSVKLEKGKELLLDSAQLSRLFLYFDYDEQRRMIPEIKMYAIRSPYDYIGYPKGYFQFFLSDNSAYSFSDTLIISGVAEGEMGSSILTVWKKEEDKYRFISVLEKSLITYAHVDSVFNLGRNKYLIAGLSGWGDAGDGAGSIWFAVWELPGSFRMIYYDKWFSASDDDTQYSYNYTINDKSISLEKLSVSYKSSIHYTTKVHTDWKASKSIISIDLSSQTDKTSDFNGYND